jgi:hypothetical protein
MKESGASISSRFGLELVDGGRWAGSQTNQETALESDRRISAQSDYIEYPPWLTLHAGTEAMLTFAVDASGMLRHIDSVPNGKQCGCVCPACGESLIARQGAVRAHSFAHDSGAECRWAQETVLHRLAKQLIAQRGEFAVPGLKVVVERQAPGLPVRAQASLPGRTIYPQSVTLEHLLFTVRPDVVLSLGERKLLVEIAVTHKVDQSKLAKLRELGHAAVEIDLTRRRPATIGQLSAVLFGQDDRKKWLVNAKEAELRRRLEAECEERYQQQVREQAALEERIAHNRALENQRLANFPIVPAIASSAKPTLPGVRYATSGGALVLYKHADDSVRITIEGHLGVLREALERLSYGHSDGGHVMTKSAWARLVSQFGQQFGSITNNYYAPQNEE